MTRRRQSQKTVWEGIVAEDVRELWEPWMVAADKLLEDEELIERVYDAQGERHEHSRTWGRGQTAAEIVLRLLLLKHVRNWSYEVLEREVRANLAYRDFARIGLNKVPDAKTLARIGQALDGDVIAEMHRRLVELAREKGAVRGRKMRVDTTVVETNIHYPTDSGLLADGARVLTRSMQRIEKQAGRLKRRVRNRLRSVNRRARAIALAARQKGAAGEEKRRQHYRGLLRLSRQILNDARRVIAEVGEIESSRKKKLEPLTSTLAETAERVRQVIRQTRTRIFRGITQWPGKVVSLFEPHTEIIRKGKASKPTEFGKLVQVQEAENQIITHYEVFETRPSDRELLARSVDAHERVLGRVPRMVAADAGFYSRDQEKEGPRKRGTAGRGAQPLHAQPGAEATGAEPLVPQGAGVENRLRRKDQRHQAAPRFKPVPLSRAEWDEALGGPPHHGRYPDQYRQGDGCRGSCMMRALGSAAARRAAE